MTFNDGKSIIKFYKTFVMGYATEEKCISYYTGERQEIDDLFLERLRSVEQ